MVFSSTLFLFCFLPVTLAGSFVLPRVMKNYWLLFMSLVFFGWSQQNYLWIILLNIAINYFAAAAMAACGGKRGLKNLTLVCAVAGNLGLLFYFKYFGFTVELLAKITRRELPVPSIVLPIGISFFTFQGMSYMIDVYRGRAAVQKNPLKVALYVVLFPQLIAGPIVRYTDVAADIDSRTVTADDFAEGIRRFVTGLAKKTLIANTMGAAVDEVWSVGIANWTPAVSWLTMIAYTLQIYYDFSGYSDMAIGLGRMLGFHFPENFNLPYISKSITEFWRRWHISLSSWFRDYVYIPLGGNRKHVYFNLFVVFLLTGIWHGAAVHYVAWGLWNGLFILAERWLKLRGGSRAAAAESGRKGSCLRNAFARLYTLAVVASGWVMFRAASVTEALLFLKTLVVHVPEKPLYDAFWFYDRFTLTMLALGILFASALPARAAAYVREHMGDRRWTVCAAPVLLILFVLCASRITAGSYNPFIYFQF